ncbi:MAG: hypothetical protein AB7P49_15190 [Bdellovibrionales bacterium]
MVDPTPPTAPQSLTAAPGNGQVSLSWLPSTDALSGVVSYSIYQDGIPLGGAATTSYTVPRLTNGKTYTYTVRAKDRSGNESGPSNSVNATPRP